MDVAINLHHQYVITFGQGSCMLIYLNFEFRYGIIASFKKKEQYVYTRSIFTDLRGSTIFAACVLHRKAAKQALL